MGSADSVIRVSSHVKEVLDGLKREGESYNDVIERLIDRETEKDFEAGFGILADSETAAHVQRARESMDEQMDDVVDAIADDR